MADLTEPVWDARGYVYEKQAVLEYLRCFPSQAAGGKLCPALGERLRQLKCLLCCTSCCHAADLQSSISGSTGATLAVHCLA